MLSGYLKVFEVDDIYTGMKDITEFCISIEKILNNKYNI